MPPSIWFARPSGLTVRYDASDGVDDFYGRLVPLLDYLLPAYVREGKAHLTVGIGCTGGRHRSVMIANELTRRLRRAGFDARSTHRDIRKADAHKRGFSSKRSREA